MNGGRFATIADPAGIGALLRAIDGYEGTFVGRCALRLAPLVFVQPGELRAAGWSDFLDGLRAGGNVVPLKMSA